MKKHNATIRNGLSGIGIRGKILGYLAIFVAFILSLVWVCQIALLFDFYRNHRSSQMSETAEAIVANLENEELETLADKLSADNDLCILLLNEENRPIISRDHVRFCLIHNMGMRELTRMIDEAPTDGTSMQKFVPVRPFMNERYKKNRYTGPVPDETTRADVSLINIRKVDLGEGKTGTLILDAVITPLGSTIDTLKKQFASIVLVVLLVAVIIGIIISRSITRPIIETNKAARELGNYRYERPEHWNGYREIAELNETLVQASADLNRVETLQRELMANISHDLRTPLTMIGGYAEVMRDIPDENTPENMQIIIDETNRLTSLVNEVLEFSRIQAGNKAIQTSEYELTEQLHSVCERVSKMVRADGYTVIFNNMERVNVNADEQAVAQVTYNLLGNALTYTGEDRKVTVRQEVKENVVRVSIADSGSGISEEELPYIWDRYYRTKDSHKRAVIGSGLGLSIVRGILEKHGASYGVDSIPGTGTSFWFELPIAKS